MKSALKEVLIVGDRVLIQPKKNLEKTQAGLYLPPGVQEKEKVQSGYIVKTGPGYPMPTLPDEGAPWKEEKEGREIHSSAGKARGLNLVFAKGCV